MSSSSRLSSWQVRATEGGCRQSPSTVRQHSCPLARAGTGPGAQLGTTLPLPSSLSVFCTPFPSTGDNHLHLGLEERQRSWEGLPCDRDSETSGCKVTSDELLYTLNKTPLPTEVSSPGKALPEDWWHQALHH